MTAVIEPVRELQGVHKRWQIAEHIDPVFAAQVPGVSRMVAHLLFQRGYQDAESIARFFAQPGPEHDPTLIPDMVSAVERIRDAVARRERVAIYGDFDSDGLTASAILLETFRGLGLDPSVVIPTRAEGHGMNLDRVRMLADEGVTLIVSADCGIGDLTAVREARRLGVEVIVTDHHQPLSDGSLPDGLVVSPTRHDSLYPWPFLSGAGVAYKLAQALLLRPEVYESLLDLVAFGTIADVVRLRDENRTLVIKGLGRLRETNRCGLRALFGVAKIDSRRLDHASVGFYLGPRINAANRMADPAEAFDLITATDAVEAQRIALLLDGHNSTRQDEVARLAEAALESIGPPLEVTEDIRQGRRAPIICLMGDWRPGLSGLLASDLTEAYSVPAIVAASKGDGTVTASGRSTKDVNILELLEAVDAARPGLLLGFGGHSAACGFTVRDDRVDEAFREVETAAHRLVPISDLGARLRVDAQIRLGQVELRSLQMVEELGPYGQEFEEPTFLAQGVYLSSRRKMGPNGKHVKMTARSGTARVSAVMFGCDPQLADLLEEQPVDVVFNIIRDDWDGMFRPQICIRDWRLYEGALREVGPSLDASQDG